MGRRSREKDHRRRQTADAAAKGADATPRVAAVGAVASDAPAVPHGLTLTAAIAGLAVLGVYLATLNPTVSHGDSGEMITVARTLGVAHPPGFPLFALLGALFARLPIASVAWRVNLFSAVADAAAAFFLCRATGRCTGSRPLGVLAAGAFAFSPIVWPYAVTAEVFALNNLFIALLVDLTSQTAVAGRDTAQKQRLLLATIFIFGLGLSNHQILVLLAGPALVFSLLAGHRFVRDPRALTRLALAFAAGFVPYVYLVVAPHFGSEMVWGDTATPGGLLHHVLRTEYGTLQLGTGVRTGTDDTIARLANFATRLTQTTFWCAPALLAAAIPALIRRSAIRGWARMWAFGLAAHLLLFSVLSNLPMREALHVTVQERFWQQAIAVAAVFMALGAAELARHLPSMAATAARLTIGIGLPIALAGVHYRAMDQSRHVYFREWGQAILQSMPRGAILVITSDEAVGSVRHLQQIEGLRRDVRVLPAGQIANPWFRKLTARSMPELKLPPSRGADGFTFHEFLDLNQPRTRVFLFNKVPWLQTLEEAYSPWPCGLADEVLPKGTEPPVEECVEQGLASFARFDPASRGSYEGSWERYVEVVYWKQFERFGLTVSTMAARTGGDPHAARLVVRALEPLLAKDPTPPATLLKNAGVAYQFLLAVDPAARDRMVQHWKRYLAVAPPSDPDRTAIERAIAHAEGR